MTRQFNRIICASCIVSNMLVLNLKMNCEFY
uniref:Uncharacterized protein n=1 Tax=Anguilla anguilla TaxID=7936 RepID=A0A0E9X7X8_ANGAN